MAAQRLHQQLHRDPIGGLGSIAVVLQALYAVHQDLHHTAIGAIARPPDDPIPNEGQAGGGPYG